MIRIAGAPFESHDPKLKREAVRQVASDASEVKTAVVRKAVAETKVRVAKPAPKSNRPQSNTAAESNSAAIGFDKKAYQRDLMRKRRAAVSANSTKTVV